MEKRLNNIEVDREAYIRSNKKFTRKTDRSAKKDRIDKVVSRR
jgi:hypothetical protein